MKKNRMMRLASILLVCVLLSTSVISGTFAKYTTQDSASDVARVAKWGVTLQVAGNLYGETYGAVTGNSIVDNAATGFTVQSLNAVEGVVAPGTKNDEGFTFSLNGKPEVSGAVTATITYENIYLTAGTYAVMVAVPAGTINAGNYHEFVGLYVKNDEGVYSAASDFDANKTYYTLEDDVFVATDYYPVEYAMSGSTTNYNNPYSDTALSVNTLKGMSEAIATCFGTLVGEATVVDGKTTITYAGTSFVPNQELKNVVKLENQRITWKWDFCQEVSDHVGHAACNYCKADTILGNLMVGTDLSTSYGGEVVKLQADNITYKAPVAATGTEQGDFNLQTEFSIDITVTQVD